MAKEERDHVVFNFNDGRGLSVHPDGKFECRKLLEEVHRCFAEGKPFFHSKKHMFMLSKKNFSYGYVTKKLMEKKR